MTIFPTLQRYTVGIAFIGFTLSLLLSAAVTAKSESKKYQLDYTIALQPKKDRARVTIRISDGRLLKSVDFKIDPKRHTDIKGDGRLRIKDDRAIWTPPNGPAKFDFTAKISSKRRNGAYDAIATEDWAIFRGDDIIPAATVKSVKGAESRARLTFKLPRDWTNVDTGWLQDQKGRFIINNPDRSFDRPIGWIIAGKVGTRRDSLRETEVSIGAPKGSSLHRMDVLTFFNFVWPEVVTAFHKLPPKLLIVGAGDPMWRGGLSSPNSLFMHADRPLVSENATSSLLHELTHVITRIRGYKNADWIAEGIAEYYAIELLYRSGGMSKPRYRKVRKWLQDWSKDIETLRVKNSTGPTTARAVILLQDLDTEIRDRTNGKHSLDNVTRDLMRRGKVSLKSLRASAERLVGGELKALDSTLLKKS